MAAILREELAKGLINEANKFGGTYAVEVLESECKKFLADKPRILDWSKPK